jgi:hydroxymethylbilane synthase
MSSYKAHCVKTTLTIGARSSNLSKAQVHEVLCALNKFYPEIEFAKTWVETTGDKDQKTSLKTLGQTDFFTKEVDEMQLQGLFRISIHSAKDLPHPLTKGLKQVALTACIDPQDALVLRNNDTIKNLPKGAKIATSSFRREEAIKGLRDDFEIVDIRGTIEKRLEALDQKLVDGVVIAEAALIRLQLTHYNRVMLEGETAQYQGQLAIIARDDDEEMEKLFSCLDTTIKKKLYLGLEAPDSSFLHCPIIQTIPLPLTESTFKELVSCSHIIITSKMCARYFMKRVVELNIDPTQIQQKEFLSIGTVTTSTLNSLGCLKVRQASKETAEGIIELLQTLTPSDCSIFWPHSKKSRPEIGNFLCNNDYRFIECILYDTIPLPPKEKPSLIEIDEIYFTSPSCIDAYLSIFGALPLDKKLKTQGQITESYLQKLLKRED